MATYKVKITYDDDYEEKINVDDAGAWTWITPPKPLSSAARQSVISHVHNIVSWLKVNGGVKLDVKEEP